MTPAVSRFGTPIATDDGQQAVINRDQDQGASMPAALGEHIHSSQRFVMGLLELLLLIFLILLVFGALPVYPHSRTWGYAPSGGLVTILLIVLLLVIIF